MEEYEENGENYIDNEYGDDLTGSGGESYNDALQGNPFADLIPNVQAKGQSFDQNNPFSDLVPVNNNPTTAQKHLPNQPQSMPGRAPQDKRSFARKAGDTLYDMFVTTPYHMARGTGQGLRKAKAGLDQITLGTWDKLFGTNYADSIAPWIEAETAAYERENGGHPAARIGELLGESAPYMALPGGIAGSVGKRVATGAVAGGAMGAGQYVPEGGSRAMNAAIGAATGGLLPPVLSGLMSKNPITKAAIGAGIGGIIGSSEGMGGSGTGAGVGAVAPFIPGAMSGYARNLLSKTLNKPELAQQSPITSIAAHHLLKGVDPEKAMASQAAAKRLGVDLTPAEASGSTLAAKTQGKLGTSEEGSAQLDKFAANRKSQEQKAIDELLADVSEDGGSASAEVRNAARQVFSAKKEALNEKAAPLYDKALYTTTKEGGKQLRNVPNDVFENIMQDPIVEDAVAKIAKNKIYQKELKDAPASSVKYLDYVKRYIDDQNSSAIRKGLDNKSRLLTASKNDLVKAIDSAVPDYQQARVAYSEEVGPLKKLMESNLGRISDLKDTDLKKVSKIIFDPAETDLNVMQTLRKGIEAKDPFAWKKMVRNEMERRLDKPGKTGSAFYKKILESDSSFNQFMEATKGMPKVQQKLKDMRVVFKDLINPETVKSAAGKSQSGMYQDRNTKQELVDWIKNMAGGQYDKAAVKLITSNKWDKELANIRKIKSSDERSKQLAALLGRIAGLSTINALEPKLGGIASGS